MSHPASDAGFAFPPVALAPGWIAMELGHTDWTTVLAAVASTGTAICLHGGPGQAVWVGLSEAPRRLDSWSDLRGLDRSAQPAADPLQAGWWEPGGAAVVQLDHEFPTGGAGWLWRPTAWVQCRADGETTLAARDGACLAEARGQLLRGAQAAIPPRLTAPLIGDWDAAGHRERVERLRACIAAGDIYQANLTLGWRGRCDAGGASAAATLFARLVARSPAGHAALLARPGRTVLCHSPETFLRLDRGAVFSEPIKGTRRRTADGSGRAELLASAKDAAELAMIVDLMRNDLSISAATGSVRVLDPGAVIDLPHLHHRCGRIAATLRQGLTAADLVAGAFPPGSVTGCPKRRASQIIADLETAPRGPYCGTIGWLADDACDLAVAIRCAVLDDDGSVSVHAGGGITADSDGYAEWDEARAKAAAMLDVCEGR
jgi:anthranilate/para-aminobenzoate synthase component I